MQIKLTKREYIGTTDNEVSTGIIQVDTESKLLGVNEYCFDGTYYYVSTINSMGNLQLSSLTEEEFTNLYVN